METSLMAIPDVCNELRLGKTKVFAEIGAGRIRTVKVGTRRLVTRATLEEYVALLEHESAQ